MLSYKTGNIFFLTEWARFSLVTYGKCWRIIAGGGGGMEEYSPSETLTSLYRLKCLYTS